MENDEISMEISRGRGKNKQVWKEEEVKALVVALKAVAVDTHWKADCGFRSNYMHEVHMLITLDMPTFTKQVDPHIASKLKWLKTKYNVISEMLRESGCSWNYDEHKIKCEREWYDAWIQRHSNAKGIWELKFPYLDELELAYRRDRATGQNAQGFDDAINTMETESHAFTEEGTEQEHEETFHDESSNANAESSSTKQKRHAAPTKMDSKKKKRSGGTSIEVAFDKVSTKLEKCIDGISTHFASIAESLADENKCEQVSFAQKSSIIGELQELDLTSAEIFKAADIIGGDEAKMRNFFQLADPEMRRQYVHSLLQHGL